MRLINFGRHSVSKSRALFGVLVLAALSGAVALGGQVIYEYDNLGRLKSVSHVDGKQTNYVLDAAGNRTSVTTLNLPPAPVINDVATWNNTGSFPVNWSAPTTPIVITRYELNEAVNNGPFSTTSLVSTAVIQYSATGRGEGRYYYRVRACSADGCGRYATFTNPVTVDLTPPATVTGVASSAITQTTATVAWNVTTDNFELQDYQYRVLPSSTWLTTGTVRSANLTGLTAQTDYRVEVRARDRANNPSSVSSTLFTTLRPVPTAPTNLAINQNANCSWRATWSAVAGASSYTVRETGPLGTEYSTSNTEFYISCPNNDPEANKPKWVKACNANGCSPSVNFGTAGDTQAPTQPGVLQFPSILHNGATVAWPASSDNVAVYLYDYRVNGAGPWISVFTSSATLSGLSVSTTYNLEVRAMDAAGNLSPIRTGSFTTLAAPDTTPPGAPGNPSVSGIQAYQATVNWTAASDNVGVTGYRFKPTVGSSWTTVGNVLTGTQTGLIASTQYTIEVQARDATGNWGASAQTAAFTTSIGIPPTPTGLSINHIANCAWSASWNASLNATSYVVRDTNGAEVTTTSLSSTVNCPNNDPEANKPRYVKACNASGCSANAEFTPPASGDTSPPTQPGTLSFTSVTATSALVSWGASSDNFSVTSYEYQLNSGTWVALGLATNVSLSGLTGATTYSFTVRARDAANNLSTPRTASFTTTDQTAPTQPGTVTFSSVTGTTATAGWGASSDSVGVTGYDWRLNNTGNWTTVTTNSASLTGLTGSTNYPFEVRARDLAGNLSTVRTATLTTADGSAPSQPGTVTISLVTATSARATWVAATDNVAVTAYDYRLNGGSWVALSNVTQVDIPGLTQLTSYTVEIRARDAAGNAGAPRAASPFTTLDGSAPSQPGTVTISAITATTATAGWGASSDNVAVTAYNYRLNGGSWTNAGNVTTVNLTGLSQATGYTFEVQARDQAGNVSVVRTAPVFTTLDISAPTQPSSITASSVGAFSAQVEWGPSSDNVAVGAYQWRLTTQVQWTETGLSRIAFLSGLAPQTPYTVEVRARDNSNNVSTVVTTSFTTTIAPPAAPTNLSYNQVADCAWNASWGGVSGATRYDVRDTSGNVQQTTNTSISINCPIGNPQGNKPQWVKACNGGGCSGEANFGGQGGDQLAPSVPTGLTASNVQPTTATISWNASTDNVGVAGYQWAVDSSGWTGVSIRSVGITGLQDNFTHTAYVRAYDAAGNYSDYTSVQFYTPLSPDVTPPGAVQNLRVGSLGASATRLDWDAATDNIAVAGYTYRLTSSSTWINGTALSANMGVTPSTPYTFEVRARDSAGNLGPISSIPFTTPAGIPNQPADAWASQGSQCHWNTWWTASSSGSAPTYFRVRASENGTETDVTSQPFAISFPPCDDPQRNKPQWVKACNASGCSTSKAVRIQ